ncbi:F-box domain-containing protein [Mycena chlorophos]|uniref:F-box domain-containing protein n=1 Tax=Mycena chlorophos TaxID=658473 RepID=A0A8H6TET4_MYCCL|nr:F-box domain-containing protein [Mycena chlorophos]
MPGRNHFHSTPMDTLPDELLLHVLACLPHHALLSTIHTSQRLRRVGIEPYLASCDISLAKVQQTHTLALHGVWQVSALSLVLGLCSVRKVVIHSSHGLNCEKVLRILDGRPQRVPEIVTEFTGIWHPTVPLSGFLACVPTYTRGKTVWLMKEDGIERWEDPTKRDGRKWLGLWPSTIPPKSIERRFILGVLKLQTLDENTFLVIPIDLSSHGKQQISFAPSRDPALSLRFLTRLADNLAMENHLRQLVLHENLNLELGVVRGLIARHDRLQRVILHPNSILRSSLQVQQRELPRSERRSPLGTLYVPAEYLPHLVPLFRILSTVYIIFPSSSPTSFAAAYTNAMRALANHVDAHPTSLILTLALPLPLPSPLPEAANEASISDISELHLTSTTHPYTPADIRAITPLLGRFRLRPGALISFAYGAVALIASTTQRELVAGIRSACPAVLGPRDVRLNVLPMS